MTTPARIREHERAVESVLDTWANSLPTLFDQLNTRLISLGNTPTTEDILRAFAPVIASAQNIEFDLVYQSLLLMLEPIIEDQSTPVDVNRVQGELRASVENHLREEASAYIAALVFGAAGALVYTQLRERVPAIVRRIRSRVAESMRSAEGALTIAIATAQGIDRFRYTGGTVERTRPFCNQHDGEIMTTAEIQRIWRNQTWQGKAPGNPFVVRGGYNCRHRFVPVRGE